MDPLIYKRPSVSIVVFSWGNLFTLAIIVVGSFQVPFLEQHHQENIKPVLQFRRSFNLILYHLVESFVERGPPCLTYLGFGLHTPCKRVPGRLAWFLKSCLTWGSRTARFLFGCGSRSFRWAFVGRFLGVSLPFRAGWGDNIIIIIINLGFLNLFCPRLFGGRCLLCLSLSFGLCSFGFLGTRILFHLCRFPSLTFSSTFCLCFCLCLGLTLPGRFRFFQLLLLRSVCHLQGAALDKNRKSPLTYGILKHFLENWGDRQPICLSYLITKHNLFHGWAVWRRIIGIGCELFCVEVVYPFLFPIQRLWGRRGLREWCWGKVRNLNFHRRPLSNHWWIVRSAHVFDAAFTCARTEWT